MVRAQVKCRAAQAALAWGQGTGSGAQGTGAVRPLAARGAQDGWPAAQEGLWCGEPPPCNAC